MVGEHLHLAQHEGRDQQFTFQQAAAVQVHDSPVDDHVAVENLAARLAAQRRPGNRTEGVGIADRERHEKARQRQRDQRIPPPAVIGHAPQQVAQQHADHQRHHQRESGRRDGAGRERGVPEFEPLGQAQTQALGAAHQQHGQHQARQHQRDDVQEGRRGLDALGRRDPPTSAVAQQQAEQQRQEADGRGRHGNSLHG